MNLKKNVFSHLIWFVYAASVCGGVLWILVSFGSKVGYTKAEGFMFGSVWLAVCGWIVFMRKQHSEDAEYKRRKRRLPKSVIEIAIAVLLLVVGLFFRIQGVADSVEGANYYELAKVVENQATPSVEHGVTYVYLEVLHFVYVLFGNKFVAGVWLQIVLLVVSAIFMYFAVREMAGTIPALTSLAVLMLGSNMISESLALSPQILFMTIYAIVLSLCTSCIAGEKQAVNRLLTGSLIGVVCYFDIMGVTLLLFLLCGILAEKSEERESIPDRLLGSSLAFLGAGLGFLLLVLLNSLISSTGFLDVVIAWWQLYKPSAFAFPHSLSLTGISFGMVVLLFLLPFGAACYWFQHETEKQSIWILTVIALFVLAGFGMTTEEMDGTLQFYILFAVLAGISISDLHTLGIPKGETQDDELPVETTKKGGMIVFEELTEEKYGIKEQDEEDSVVEEPIYEEEEPVAEEPVYEEEEPVAEEPAYEEEEPVAEEPVYEEEEPVAEDPIYEEGEPVAEEPVYEEEEPVAEEPVYEEEEPVAEDPIYEEGEPVAEEPVYEEEEPVAEEPVYEEEESVAEEPAYEAPVQEESRPKVRFLENPLPLPKAHVKKVLDYDIVDIHPTLNCYDVRVPIDDDFDI